MKKILLAALAVTALAGSALAADLARPAPVYKAPPVYVPVSTWTGFYVGLHAGANWSGNGNINHTAVAGPCNPAFGGCVAPPATQFSSLLALGSTFGGLGGSNNGNFVGGGQIGYNWQFGLGVWGVEADIAGLGRNNNGVAVATVTPNPAFPGFAQLYAATVTRQLNYLGTVRGRAGWLATPELLIFATAGLAYGGTQSTTNELALLQTGCPTPNCALGTGGGNYSQTRIGWTAGAGFEWMAGPHWSVVGQYLYYDLGTANYATALSQLCQGAACVVPGGLVASTTGATSVRFNGSIARIGFNYKFGYDPVVPAIYK
jgi:outer membrane immunogenic protein